MHLYFNTTLRALGIFTATHTWGHWGCWRQSHFSRASVSLSSVSTLEGVIISPHVCTRDCPRHLQNPLLLHHSPLFMLGLF